MLADYSWIWSETDPGKYKPKSQQTFAIQNELYFVKGYFF